MGRDITAGKGIWLNFLSNNENGDFIFQEAAFSQLGHSSIIISTWVSNRHTFKDRRSLTEESRRRNKAFTRPTLGIRGKRERVTHLGSTFEIRSSGDGTLVPRDFRSKNRKRRPPIKAARLLLLPCRNKAVLHRATRIRASRSAIHTLLSTYLSSRWAGFAFVSLRPVVLDLGVVPISKGPCVCSVVKVFPASIRPT